MVACLLPSTVLRTEISYLNIAFIQNDNYMVLPVKSCQTPPLLVPHASAPDLHQHNSPLLPPSPHKAGPHQWSGAVLPTCQWGGWWWSAWSPGAWRGWRRSPWRGPVSQGDVVLVLGRVFSLSLGMCALLAPPGVPGVMIWKYLVKLDFSISIWFMDYKFQTIQPWRRV